MKRAALLPAVAILLTGCAAAVAPASPPTPKAAAVTVPTQSAVQLAEQQAAQIACTTGRKVAQAVYALRHLPPYTALVVMNQRGHKWGRQLAAAEASPGSGIPHGPNEANEVNVDLAELVLALDLSAGQYSSGNTAQAVADYTRFNRLLVRMLNQYC